MAVGCAPVPTLRLRTLVVRHINCRVTRTFSRPNACGQSGQERHSGNAPIGQDTARRPFCGRHCRGNSRGNCDSRIDVNPINIGVFRFNSMVSGPTNSRCSGTIGDDRGGTAFGSKHRKSRCVGLESAYKGWSLTIAEDRDAFYGPLPQNWHGIWESSSRHALLANLSKLQSRH